jgi:hypothetical protein
MSDNDPIRRGDVSNALNDLFITADNDREEGYDEGISAALEAIAALPAVAASQPADPVINADSRQRVTVVEKPDRSTFDAMCAMRNAINEHIPMPSLESDLLQGPENSVFCATVAEAVIKSHIRLKRDLETANYQVERLQSSFNDMAHVADDWMRKAEGLQNANPARVVVTAMNLSDMLKHAFISGRISAGAPSSSDANAWAEYDPTDCSAYDFILAAIDVQPDPRDAQIAALVEALTDTAAILQALMVAGKVRGADQYRIGGVYLQNVSDTLDAADAAVAAAKGGAA